jgi:acyl carrier protein
VTEAEVGDRLERFVREQFAIDPSDARFGRSVDLFEGAYVDSVGLAETLAFIEDEFGVTVPDEELLAEEFGTIDGMAAAVCRLL